MADKDPTSPATTSDAHDAMAARLDVMDTVLGGTESMRAAGERFCPRHQEETEFGYRARLDATTLLNMTEQTLDNLSGKPFSEPVTVNDDVPKAIVDQVLNDVDMQGNNIDVFARRWFREGMSKALCHVLVDMPRPAEVAAGTVRTLDDDRKEGVRPYWVLIRPECVIFARADVEDGTEVLKHVRIFETYTEQVGFAEVTKPRIRILEPGLVQLWEPSPTKKKEGEPVWLKTDEWDTTLDYIPLVTFYADREEFMVGKPPLLDLAYLNITHWQSTADQRHILTVARFPILACSGATAEDSDPIVVGPNKVLYNSDPKGKFYYVEHQGKAIEAGRQDLQDLQEQMGGYGAEFLKTKPGSTTATARALDSAEASSDLSAMAGVFEDAMAQVLDITAEWMKLPDEGGTIELVKSFDLSTNELPALQTLTAARAAKDISRRAYLTALMANGVLDANFDIDGDEQLIEEEAASALEKSMLILDPAAPPVPGAPAPAPGAPAPPPAAPAPPPKPPVTKGKTKPAASKKPSK